MRPPTQTLMRLRAAADGVQRAWPKMPWSKVSGPGPDTLVLDSNGSFQGLALEPGSDLTLRATLDLPAELAGVPIAGDPLELTIFSIYPIKLSLGGQPILEETVPPVAAGPALVQVVPELKAGANGELEVTIHVPPNQTTRWVQLRFTTPKLRARFELLDVIWAELMTADTLAVTERERELLVQAAALVPENLNDGEALEEALGRIEERLAPLAARADKLTVHVIGHSHIDMNWLWTWPDTVEVIRRDFKNVLALMDDYPELIFTHSQPATYRVIQEREGELFARVLEHIDAGRWEAATMTWVEGDTNMASGEATARQLLEGVRYSQDELGAKPSTFLAPDTFGHAGNLPQLAVSAGAARYYHHRCNPGQADLWPAYWWEGQDGTRLLAMSTPSYNGEIRARDLAEATMRAYRHGHAVSLHFHGIGDHGGGPARHSLEALRRFQRRPLLPKARCSTLEAYSQELLASGVALPVHYGESATIFEGCYTTHADTKRYNRQGENLLTTADTLAALTNQSQPQLREAWRSVLFNQFHDILDGSAIHESYDKHAADFAEIKATAEAAIDESLQVLEEGLAPGTIAVTNPLGWEREDWVTLPGRAGTGAVWLMSDHGHRTPGQYTADGLGFIARVPAFATVGYHIEEASEPLPTDLEAAPSFAPTDQRESNLLSSGAADPPYFRIETKTFRLYLRRDSGILVSFSDKRVNRELVGFGMRRGSDYLDAARADLALNVLQLLEEHPHPMSAWHLDEVHSERSLLRGASSEVVESGPARLVIEVKHQLGASSIVQRIVFYRELPRVDFETSIDWRELGGPEEGVPNLKVAFTARLPEAEAWFETPFAAVRRPADGQEVPALRWADVGGGDYGVALLNDGKYGHDALGNRLRLTLVRSAYEPDSISDVGTHEVRYSLLPHPGGWREAGVVRSAAAFNQPLLAREVKRASTSSTKPWRPEVLGGSLVLIGCLKMAHDGSGRIVRLYESAGRTAEIALVGLEGARAWETDIVEERMRELEVKDGRLRLTFRPWQVRTLLLG
jgi:alpha-mannosidase